MASPLWLSKASLPVTDQLSPPHPQPGVLFLPFGPLLTFSFHPGCTCSSTLLECACENCSSSSLSTWHPCFHSFLSRLGVTPAPQCSCPGPWWTQAVQVIPVHCVMQSRASAHTTAHASRSSSHMRLFKGPWCMLSPSSYTSVFAGIATCHLPGCLPLSLQLFQPERRALGVGETAPFSLSRGSFLQEALCSLSYGLSFSFCSFPSVCSLP